MKKQVALLAAFIFVLTVLSYPKDGQFDIDELKKDAPRVFLDCRRCDRDYIRTEIPFVNFVRDRKEADIHRNLYVVLIISLQTFKDRPVLMQNRVVFLHFWG